MDNKEALAIAEHLKTLTSSEEVVSYLTSLAKEHPEERLLRLAYAQKIHDLLIEEQESVSEADNPVLVDLEKEYHFASSIKAIKEALSHQDFQQAELSLEGVMPFVEEVALFYQSQKKGRYAYYEDSYEEFVDFFLHQKEGLGAEVLYPLGEIYALKAAIGYETNDLKSALSDIKKALNFSPAHFAFYQERYTILLALKKDPALLKKELVAMFPYVRKGEDLRQLYDALADLSEEKGAYRDAEIYHALGLSFAENDEAEKQESEAVERISDTTGIPYQNLDAKELHAFLDKEAVPMGSSSLFLQALEQLVILAGKRDKDYEVAIPLAEQLVSLSCHEESAEALLSSLKEDQAKAKS